MSCSLSASMLVVAYVLADIRSISLRVVSLQMKSGRVGKEYCQASEAVSSSLCYSTEFQALSAALFACDQEQEPGI